MLTPSKYTDKELFSLIARDDETAYKGIFRLYKEKLFVVALKMLHDSVMAEEIVQDVFLSLWVSRAKLGAVDNPGGYLFTMTYNRITSELRKIAADQKLRQELLKKYNGPVKTTEETVDAREKENLILRAIEALPPQRQLVYKLNRMEGLSYEEIAIRLGISRHTVRNQLAEAIKSIRAYLHRVSVVILLLIQSYFK